MTLAPEAKQIPHADKQPTLPNSAKLLPNLPKLPNSFQTCENSPYSLSTTVKNSPSNSLSTTVKKQPVTSDDCLSLTKPADFPERSVLRGSFHQGHPKFGDAQNKQWDPSV